MNPHFTHEYWLDIVHRVAQASTCRVKLGCVLVQKNNIVGMGYTGSVSGDVHCEDVGCLLVENHGKYGTSDTGKSCIRTVHAEMNALLKCAIKGSDQNGWLACYSTYSPCLSCLKLLLQKGVKTFVFAHQYKDENRSTYLDAFMRVNELVFIRVESIPVSFQASQNHGDSIACPTCSSSGHYDALKGTIWAFEDNIWFDKVIDRWACFDCYLK